ncbi:MAG: Leucine rich repeat-containing protein [Verrucomicrobiaceae bacterium]|nr:Leucine rich repeat-containing protein [Verrucomicrobiaceae bacterium]
MLRTSLLALIAFASLVHAQEDKALADTVAKINATGASLAPVAADAKTYRFTALNVAKDFNDAGLAALAPVADKLVAVDLARTKVTDGGLKALEGMKNLTEIHLENTPVTDAGLDHLTGLASLEYLNLYSTKVTDAGVKKLTKLGKLKALYLWQTAVTKEGATALKKAMPSTHVNIGWTSEDDAKPVAVVAAAPAPAAAPIAAAPAKDAAKPAPPAPAADAAKPAAASAPLDPAAAAKAIVFKDVVLPIIESKCVACHGAEKAKGKLRMHTFEAIMKGGSDGATTVVAGKPADSLMIKRVNLPKDDDDHMPPADEKQLTKEEVAVLKWWVEQGASDSITVAAIKKTPDVEGILGSLIKSGAKAASAAAPKVAAKPKPKPLTDAEKKAVAMVAAKMQALGASLMPLALDTEQQRLSVINAADKFGDKEVAELLPIAAQVLWVDLARSQVTDAGIATLAKLPNLERLHLENTKVTDTGLASLTGLKGLEYLNLYGTKVTDAGIAKLAANKELKKLFVWQTGVTQAGAKALEAKVPGLVVNVGLSEAEIAKLTAPPPAPPPAPKPAAAAPAAKKDAAKPAATPPAKKDEAKPATPPPAAKKEAASPPAAKKDEAKPATPPPAVKKEEAKPAAAPVSAKKEEPKPAAK